jgi:hypothetical protein
VPGTKSTKSQFTRLGPRNPLSLANLTNSGLVYSLPVFLHLGMSSTGQALLLVLFIVPPLADGILLGTVLVLTNIS